METPTREKTDHESSGCFHETATMGGKKHEEPVFFLAE
jgi:hypothetical protein